MVLFEEINTKNFHNTLPIISTWWSSEECQEILQDLSPDVQQDWASFCKRYFILNKDKNYVGIIGLTQSAFRETPNEAWLGWFCVKDSFRSKSYGKQALIKIIEIAKENGIEILRIESQPSRSKAANQLYQSLGFKREKYTKEPEFSKRQTYIFSMALKENLDPSIKDKNFDFIREYDL